MNSSSDALFDLTLIERHVRGGDVFIEREWLYDEVTSALQTPGRRVVLLTGSPGSGKSNVMAILADRRPDWPRYFIRRVNEEYDGHRRDGDLASFLVVIGLQLAALVPRRLSDLPTMISVYQGVQEIGPDGRVTAVEADQLVVSPFRAAGHQILIQVQQHVGTVRGELVGVNISSLVLEPRLRPSAMVGEALVTPARLLAREHPDQRIVILIDGLDELRFRGVADDLGDWLADAVPDLPSTIQFVITSRPGEPRLARIRSALAEGMTLRTVDLDALAREHDDVGTYLRRVSEAPSVRPVLDSHGVHPDLFVQAVSTKAGGNFQYATLVTRAVRAATDAGGVAWLTRVQELPGDLDSLYGLFLLRVRDETHPLWPDVFHPLLSILAVARESLTPAQLAAFAPVNDALRDAEGALSQLGPFLDVDGAGRYRLYHGSLPEFLLAVSTHDSRYLRDLYCDGQTIHHHIVDHAVRAYGGDWPSADPYLLRHVAAHAGVAGMLDGLLADPRFLLAADVDGLTSAFIESGTGSAIAGIYKQALPALRDDGPTAAPVHWELYARRAGLNEFADRVHQIVAGPWRAAWTDRMDASSREIGEHPGEITAVAAVQVDGLATAITGGRDATLRLWDIAAGRGIGALHHGGSATIITALATATLNNGEAVVFSGADNSTLCAWNLTTHEPLATHLAGLENAGIAMAVADAPDGPLAVYRVADYVRAWDLGTMQPIGPPIAVPGAERAAIAHCRDRVLIVASQFLGDGHGVARVFDAATGKQVGLTMHLHDHWVEALALGQVGDRVLVVLGSSDLQVWDLFAGAPAGPPIPQRNVAASLAITDAGRPVLAVADREHRLWVIDPTAEDRLGAPVLEVPHEVTALGWHGHDLLVAGMGHVYRYVRDPGGRLLPTGRIRTVRDVRNFAYTQLSRTAMVTVDAHGDVRVQDPDTGEPMVDARLLGNHRWGRAQERIYSVAAATIGGRTLVAAGAGETVRFWDLGEVPPRGPAEVVSSTVTAFSDGKALHLSEVDQRAMVVCVTRTEDVYCWDPETGEITSLGRGINGYVTATAVGDVDGRPVVVRGSDGCVVAHLLPTGDPVWSADPLPGRHMAVAVTEYEGRALVVAAEGSATFRYWDPVEGTGPRVVRAAPLMDAMAVVPVGGRPVAVYGGRLAGTVRAVDLLAGESLDEFPVGDLAAATLRGRPVVVVGGREGVRVLWADTGDQAAPAPVLRTPRGLDSRVSAVAVGTVDCRSIGVAVVGSWINSWDLETGKPTGLPPLEVESSFGGGTLWSTWLAGRPIIVQAGRDVRVFDLVTGLVAGHTQRPTGGQACGIRVAALGGRPLLVSATGNVARAHHLLTPAEKANLERRDGELTAALRRGDLSAITAHPLGNETPPPPVRLGDNLSRPGNLNAVAVAEVGGQPVVMSARSDGRVDIFAIAEATAVGEPLPAHTTPVLSLDYGDICGRPVLASGAVDGTVRFWDLATRMAMATVRTLSPVTALAIVPPDTCVIGTEHGPLAVTLALPPSTAEWTIPVDPRSTRQCPRHRQPSLPRQTEPGHWYCIKGVQLGDWRLDPLKFAQGHCAILPDRLILAPAVSGLGTLDLARGGRAHLARQDAEMAYAADGGHFRLRVESGERDFSLSFYTRAERDLFHQHLLAVWRR